MHTLLLAVLCALGVLLAGPRAPVEPRVQHAHAREVGPPVRAARASGPGAFALAPSPVRTLARAARAGRDRDDAPDPTPLATVTVGPIAGASGAAPRIAGGLDARAYRSRHAPSNRGPPGARLAA